VEPNANVAVTLPKLRRHLLHRHPGFSCHLQGLDNPFFQWTALLNLANTTPRDAGSVLRILGVRTGSDGHFVITWASAGGTRYRVVSSDALAGVTSGFQPLVRSIEEEIDPAPIGTPSTQTFTDVRPLPATGMRFYKIGVIQ
jgi:hypothetical protein